MNSHVACPVDIDSEQLDRARRLRGWTFMDLAGAAGVSESAARHAIRGSDWPSVTWRPSTRTVRKIAAALGLTLEQVLLA